MQKSLVGARSCEEGVVKSKFKSGIKELRVPETLSASLSHFFKAQHLTTARSPQTDSFGEGSPETNDEKAFQIGLEYGSLGSKSS